MKTHSINIFNPPQLLRGPLAQISHSPTTNHSSNCNSKTISQSLYLPSNSTTHD